LAREIGPETVLCGVILHPAGHTRSPAMHNAAFAALGLDAVYTAFDVLPDQLASAIAGARALGLRQLAVSIPHKMAALEHVDEVEPVARQIGALNTITAVGGRLRGANTDWIGAVRALEREGPLADRDAVVLGAGGAARAVVYGLLERGARVRILNRTAEKAAALSRALGAAGSGSLADLPKLPCDVIVNTTSVGLGADVSPVDPQGIRPGCVVMDAVYEPSETRLLRDARARGARAVGGKWMLVHQAAEQIRIWSGREAPVDVMAEAFDRAARGR
jgi:shikimate dehydrogenase